MLIKSRISVAIPLPNLFSTMLLKYCLTSILWNKQAVQMVDCATFRWWKQYLPPNNGKLHDGWGQVRIPASWWLPDQVPHGWSVYSSLRMQNWAVQAFFPSFQSLKQCWYFRLLVWQLSRRPTNIGCITRTMEATGVGLFWHGNHLCFPSMCDRRTSTLPLADSSAR